MKILVTGAAGFIGSHLVDYLIMKGYQVVGVDNFSNGLRSNIETAEKLPNFSFIDTELTNYTNCAKLFAAKDIDVVFHLAARGGVPASIEYPYGTFADNVLATHNLLVAAKEHGVQRFIYASSSSVYGNSHSKASKVESWPANPINPYGLSKSVCEQYAKMFTETYGLYTAGLRFFNVYGPRQRFDIATPAVVPSFAMKALAHKNIVINGDGLQYRDFTYVYDVVEVMGRFLTCEPEVWGGQVYNVCRDSKTTIHSLAKMIVKMTKSDSMIIDREKRKGDIFASRGSNTKLFLALGVTPWTSVENGLLETLTYYKERYQKWNM